MRLLIFVNHFLYTKSYPNKYLCLIFIIVLYSSCSPTAYILEKQPKVGSSIYSKKIKNIQNKILKSNSSDINLLQKGVQELTMYSYGFLIEESDRVVLDNYSEGKKIENEAHEYFCEAVKYGDLALSKKYENYPNWLTGSSNFLSNSELLDLSLIYWTAAAYGGAISSSSADPAWVIKLPRVGKLLNQIVHIDSSWNGGAAIVALISFTMNNPKLNFDEKIEKSKKLFSHALKVSKGNDLGPYVTYAESVSKLDQNREEFIYLLNKALNIDIKANKDLVLTNIISKNRAEWLLENIDEFFY